MKRNDDSSPGAAGDLTRQLENFQQQLGELEAAIRQRDVLNQRLRSSRERYRELFDNANDIIFTHALDGTIHSANRAACRAFGFAAHELVGKNLSEILQAEYLPRLFEHAGDHESGPQPTVPYEVPARTRSGETIWVEVNPRLIRDEQRATFVHTIARDITERKRALETIEHQATHDALTGIPNRRLFADRLRKAIGQAERDGASVAVLFLDLDRFKLINDGLGHDVGDRLLQGVAERLGQSVRGADTVARRGGDEFTILLPHVQAPQDVSITAQRILDSLQGPVLCEQHSVHVSTSIGISFFPQDGASAEDLLKFADIAMYRAKAEGRGRFRYYHERMNSDARERMAVERLLRDALREGTLSLDFQPRVDARSGRIVAFEALLRVPDGLGGELDTADVVRVAEESGLIGPIGIWVVNRVCDVLAAQPADRPRLLIVINLTERECLYGDVAATLRAALRRTGVPAAALEFDLSHGFAANDDEAARSVLRELAGIGVRLGLDNFGTAQTSLRTLRVPELSTVTIAAEYVRDVLTDERVAALTEGLIDMAHRLGIEVVGFGVESEEQLRWLADAGCDYVQGVGSGIPVAEAELRRFLAD